MAGWEKFVNASAALGLPGCLAAKWSKEIAAETIRPLYIGKKKDRNRQMDRKDSRKRGNWRPAGDRRTEKGDSWAGQDRNVFRTCLHKIRAQRS